MNKSFFDELEKISVSIKQYLQVQADKGKVNPDLLKQNLSDDYVKDPGKMKVDSPRRGLIIERFKRIVDKVQGTNKYNDPIGTDINPRKRKI